MIRERERVESDLAAAMSAYLCFWIDKFEQDEEDKEEEDDDDDDEL